MNNEQKKGYMIFNADGSQPQTTLAALETPESIQVIAQGGHGNIIKLFGSIAQGLATGEDAIPKDLLHSTIDAAISAGDMWAVMVGLVERKAARMRAEGITPDDLKADLETGDTSVRELLMDELTDELFE